ncbi:helix-turn-helix domain-containing protein [Vallitalea okinawensis]|uniref:helix-turn-helix domain-containing protein n=1 Tax=Vallitalea okinawensis TaxID=2078660 RepID=UPI000CFBC9EE|nr:helix-turn-helix domain-containing protein [Vallitalea okinawensis]
MQNKIYMKSKKSLGQGHFFHKLLFSYVTILIIPILLILMLSYFYVESYLKPSLSNIESLQLDIIKSNTESLIEQIDLIALNIMHSDNIEFLKDLTKDNLLSDYKYIENLYEITDRLSRYTQLNSNIHSIYIYNQDTSLLLTSEGKVEDVSDINTKVISNATDHEFYLFKDISWLDEYQMGNRITSPRIIKEKSNVEIFSIIYPINYKNMNSIIVMNINKGELFNFLDENTESTFILTLDNRVLYNSMNLSSPLAEADFNTIIERIKFNKDNSQGHFFYEVEDNEKYAVTYRQMNSLYEDNITFINLSPVSILFKQIKTIGILTIITSLITIIIGIAISYFVAGKLYNPVKKMLYDIKSQVKINSNGNENEFEIVASAIDELLRQEDESNKMYEINKNNLKEAHVLELIMGNENEALEQYCKLLDFTAVIVISIDNTSGFIKKYTKQDQYYYKSLFKMTCEQVANITAKGYGAVIENNKIALIITMNEYSNENLEKIGNSMLKEIMKINDFSFTIGVGKIYTDVSHIRSSYLEAMEALKYNFLFNVDSVIFYSELDQNMVQYYYPQNIDRQIINGLNSNSYDEICKVIKDFFNDVRHKKNINYDNIMGIINQILTTTIKTLITNNTKLSDIYGESFNLYKTLYANKTLEEMEHFLLRFYKDVIHYNQSLLNLDRRYVNEVIQLIDNNYTNSNLDITWVSEKLGISYSHLRKIFSDNLNVNFPDYVNNLRICRAKKLLLDSDLTIRDIALKTGFNNAQSFNRNFKKYEEITPTEYRKNIWL